MAVLRRPLGPALPRAFGRRPHLAFIARRRAVRGRLGEPLGRRRHGFGGLLAGRTQVGRRDGLAVSRSRPRRGHADQRGRGRPARWRGLVVAVDGAAQAAVVAGRRIGWTCRRQSGHRWRRRRGRRRARLLPSRRPVRPLSRSHPPRQPRRSRPRRARRHGGISPRAARPLSLGQRRGHALGRLRSGDSAAGGGRRGHPRSSWRCGRRRRVEPHGAAAPHAAEAEGQRWRREGRCRGNRRRVESRRSRGASAFGGLAGSGAILARRSGSRRQDRGV